ncbi:hypothetical protein L596_028968 [Steinernema carpocapsae]|uniref:Major facilitator superfamily (MFS) profile domain-containing protein n=1 Tax=Steinernema carpocapsae TaxID=34508 RepID=A0A4U5LT78_STECR|nr:hypothetical protein L596_028968 [Steinernema carpocapsae]
MIALKELDKNSDEFFRRVSSTSTKKAPETPSSEPLPTQNEDPNNAEGDSAISFASMSRIEWVTLILLSVITFADTVENSCISPFFPTEAEKKGMSSSEIGVIMGARQLIILIFSPVMGRFMANIGTKRMFIAGISIVGCTTITLGFMPHWPAGRPFFIIAIAVNIIEALGDTANSTASLAILAERFPGRLATLMGLFETIGGLGGMIGPLLGGFLLEKGGFELPFLLMGSIILGGAIISYWLISEVKDTGVDENKGMKAMMKLPMMWVMVYAMITSAVLLSFLDPTLGPHIQSMDISPTAMGAIFLLSSLAYTVTAPIWGYAIDKFKCTTHFIFAGSICVVPAMLLLGPSPILPLSKSIISITIGISILGVSMGAVHIPIFQQCLLTVKKYGFPDNAQTYGGVSGIYSAAVAFGGFLGPTLGGVSVDYIGFPWTTTMLSALIVIFIITLFLSYAAVGVHNRKIKRRQVVRPEPV